MHSECFDFFHSVIYTPIVFIVSQHTVHIPNCLFSHGRRHMLWRPDMCQIVFIDIEKTMIKTYSWDDIAWFIVFSGTVCILFPKIMMGWLAGVFIVSLNLCNVWNFNHVDKFEFIFFPPLYCRPVLSPEVYFVMFSLYCYVWCSKLSLGTQQAWRCVFGKYFRLKYNWKHSPFWFNTINRGKSTMYYKGFDWTF